MIINTHIAIFIVLFIGAGFLFFIIGSLWPRLWCLVGQHADPIYTGEIYIKEIDRDRHGITYANKMRCPVCGKLIMLDWRQ